MSIGQFSSGAEFSKHFGTIVLAPKCLGAEVSLCRSVRTPLYGVHVNWRHWRRQLWGTRAHAPPQLSTGFILVRLRNAHFRTNSKFPTAYTTLENFLTAQSNFVTVYCINFVVYCLSPLNDFLCPSSHKILATPLTVCTGDEASPILLSPIWPAYNYLVRIRTAGLYLGLV